MSNAPGFHRSSLLARRTAALAAAACFTMVGASAQQAGSEQVVNGPLPSSPMLSNQLLATVSGEPLNLDLAHAAGVTYSSSASPALDAVDADAAANLDLPTVPEDGSQPPPRRRYGRPRYNDNNHNADGSSKYGFLAGVGLTIPLGDTYHYLNTDYAFQVGGGRNFNKNFSLMLQFDYDHFGFNGRTITQESTIYDPTGSQGINGLLDGKTHIWSFTLDPSYNFYQSEGVGAYVVGGVGFYHKVAGFFVPEPEIIETVFGPEELEANATIQNFTSNAVGFNGGFGLTYKPSRFANQKLYVEARYVFIDNSQRYGATLSNYTTYTGSDFFPGNSNRTTYIPIKAGIRF